MLKKFLTPFLILASLLPQFSSAQTAEEITPPEIPIYLFLHHASTTPIGILAVTPFFGESVVWSYAPLDPTADAEKTEVLASDAVSNWLQTYAYDNLGNLTNKSDVGNYTYAGTNYANPHAATTINGTTYTYDNAGNLASAGSYTYAWDYANRLTDANTNGTTTHYLYDQNNQRIEQDIKIGAGATTTTTYWNKLYETRGATTTLYLFLPNGELLGTIEGNGTATSTFITHTDHLGGTNVVSDKDGNQAQLATYYPYGAKRNNELPANFRESRLFISQYDDLATSLNYLNARYYDATRGQFLSEDPVFNREPGKQGLFNPQSLNSYSYALNNPLTYSDPNGEAVPVIALAIIIAQLYSAVKDLQTAVNTLQSQQSAGQKVTSLGILGLQQINPLRKADVAVNAGRVGVSAAREAIQEGRKVQAELGFPNVKVGSFGGSTAGKVIPISVKKEAAEEANYKCVFCGSSTIRDPGPFQQHADHSISKVQGGNADITNTQNTCRTCNLQKGSMTSQEFIEKLIRSFLQ